MSQPYSGLRTLLVATIDDATNAHNGQRRRALERLGCVVTTADPTNTGWLGKLVRQDFDKRVQGLLQQHTPDLVLVSGDALSLEAVDRLRSGRSRWVHLHGQDRGKFEEIRLSAMSFDHVFVSSTRTAKQLDESGVKHAHFLAPGCDPSIHKPLNARGTFRANVVFAGAANARRERYLTELLEFGLALWGPGWRKTGLKDYCRGELPNTEDFVRAYAGATVAINIHRAGPEDRSGDPVGLNRRAFEMAAIGTTQVVDHRADLPLHFEEGSEVLTFNTPEELKGQVKRAINEDKYRDRLSANARQRALRNHTYMHRMTALLKTVMG
ncbi:MAG TPA: glycosyltransferase [Gemmatimonadales bacterium]|nr:glycosyltransferase [Gemmatimonadales bacterium]